MKQFIRYLIMFTIGGLLGFVHVPNLSSYSTTTKTTDSAKQQVASVNDAAAQNEYLLHCNHECSEMQSCFLGRCYCLPGHSGPTCTERNVYEKLQDASLCPIWTRMTQVRNQTPFTYPAEKCNVPKWTKSDDSCSILCNWQEDAGIVSVSPHIWEVVSDREHDHHTRYRVTAPSQLPEGQTRWGEYNDGFDGFKALANTTSLGRYLEVGAGLYTQIYNIMTQKPHVTPTSIYLAEPNIFRYLTMPQCLYKDSTLLGHRVHLLSVTTEDLGMVNFFDSVLVINVIEHVVDAFEFLTQVYTALKPGGLLIFAERYFDDPVEPSSMVLGSTLLHPIRVKHTVLQHFFRVFDTVYIKDFSTAQSSQRNMDEKGYYFIGRKKAHYDHTTGEPSPEQLDTLFPPQPSRTQ